MNYEIECQFLTPLNIGTEPHPDMEYSELNCQATSTDTIELVENATTGASFYLVQEVSYGDFLITTFLLLFLIFGITKFLLDFIIPKRINFKR